MYALIAAVAVRSYSPGFAASSWPQHTNRSGAISSAMSRTRFSWAVLTYPKRSDTAIASTP